MVPHEPWQNIIDCKWVFRIKRNLDGSIAWYKAGLVTKGFHQWLSLDYHETFGPMAKPTTIQTALSITLSCGWQLHQLDVKQHIPP